MKAQRRLHQLLGILFVILALTGALMNSEALRGSIADFRFALRGVHLVAGAMFCIGFFANIPYLWAFRCGTPDGLNRREYLWLLLVVCAGLIISGGGLLAALQLGWLGPGSSRLYEMHMVTALFGALIASPHLFYSIVKRRRQAAEVKNTVVAEPNPGRRSFLRYVIGGILFAGVGVAWRWLGQHAATIKTETLAIFAQCNKMTPAPIPLPESSPPKGGGYTGKFKVYKIDPQIPCATSADWKFTVSGLVDKPQSFTWEEFLKLPRVVQVSDFHCVEGWSVYTITYEGVRLSDLLERVGVKPQAKYVKFYSAEKIYTDALSLEQARLPDVMAAVLLDGSEIPSDLGGPARLVIPQMYAYKAVKWLVGMELTDAPHKGYWEVRGYPVDAWAKPGRS